jgi:hypothetical protein
LAARGRCRVAGRTNYSPPIKHSLIRWRKSE